MTTRRILKGMLWLSLFDLALGLFLIGWFLAHGGAAASIRNAGILVLVGGLGTWWFLAALGRLERASGVAKDASA